MIDEDEQPPKPKQRFTYLYAGLVFHHDRTTSHSYIQVSNVQVGGDPDNPTVTGTLAPEPSYYNKKLSLLQPGHVFTILEGASDKTVAMKTDEWIGRWHDDQKRAELQQLSEAARLLVAADWNGKKNRRQEDRLATLEPFKRAYRRARGEQRHHVLADVIRFITGN